MQNHTPIPTYTHIEPHFHQIPFRDYLDIETAEVPDSHELQMRVVWNGASYIIFTGPPQITLYRWKLDTRTKSSLWYYADLECRRLISILEAVLVMKGQWSRLPLKIKVRGETYYSPLYSHSCNAVRYPMMGLNSDGACGEEKLGEITTWLDGQGFGEDVTQGQIEGILDGVMADAESREDQWRHTLAELASYPQTYMVGQRRKE